MRLCVTRGKHAREAASCVKDDNKAGAHVKGNIEAGSRVEDVKEADSCGEDSRDERLRGKGGQSIFGDGRLAGTASWSRDQERADANMDDRRIGAAQGGTRGQDGGDRSKIQRRMGPVSVSRHVCWTDAGKSAGTSEAARGVTRS